MTTEKSDPGGLTEDDGLSLASADRQTPDEALQESEERHRTLLEALVDGVFVAQEHRFVFANAALPEMLGHDPILFKDIPFSYVIAPEDLEVWTQRFDARVGAGPEPPRNYCVRLVRENGERLEAELRARRIVYRGRPAVLGVLRDVSARRDAEIALSKSELRHRSLVEAVSAITWSCAPSGLHVAPQPEWMAFTGQTAEEMLGDGWVKAVHPEDLDAAGSKWRAAVAQCEAFENEHRIRRYDGEWRWMSVRAAPIRDVDGRVIEWFGMSIDVTERRTAQDELRASKARLRTILDGVGACIYLKDDEGRYLFANDALLRLWDVTLDDIIGFRDEKFFDQESVRDICESDRRVLKNGETVRAEETVSLRLTAETATFLTVKLPLWNEAGKVYALCGISTDITESARVAARVVASERRYRSLFENMNSGFVLFDVVEDSEGAPVDLILLSTNKEFESATGLKEAEVVGRRLTEVLPGIERDSGDWIRKYGRVALTGEACQFEQESELLGLAFSVSAYQPEARQCAVTFQDVTKRKSAEAEILRLNADLERRVVERTKELEAARHDAERDNERQRLRLALSAGAIGAWDRNLKSRDLVVDGGWRSLYGVTDDQTVSMDVFEGLVHPDDLKIVTSARDQASNFAGDGTYVVEYRIHRGDDGAERWIRSRARVYFENGLAVRVSGVSVDITDERLLEESLRERMALTERVTKSEARLRAVIDGVGDAIITIDEKGLIQSINRSGLRIFGYGQAEILGQNIRMLLENSHSGADDVIERFTGTNNAKMFGLAHHARGKRKDGSSFPIELAITEVRYDHARLFVGFVRDLSAQRKAEAEVEALRTERMSAIGGMAVALSHEINQPFLATVAYVECAHAYFRHPTPDGADKAREALELASDAILQAGQIIKHLREFTSSGEPDKTFRRLHDVLRLAVAAMSPALDRSRIQVELFLDAPCDRVLVDVVQIKQVFINLIRNAVQAMHDSAVRRLTISTAPDSNAMLRIDIADTGAGLCDTVKDRLFEPFETTKEGGMGVGLAISRSIIEAHYGVLSAHPQVGGGTIFRITLPLESESQYE